MRIGLGLAALEEGYAVERCRVETPELAEVGSRYSAPKS